MESVRLTTESLAVLAHPLRARLLSELRRDGAATATELAGRLDTNTGATSYHLRKLESVGLVTDTGAGIGKRRLWEASTRMHGWDRSDFAGDPDAEQALNWLVRHYLDQISGRYAEWLDAEARWPLAWRDAAGMGDDAVHVTAAQLHELNAELSAVIARYARAGDGDPAARTVTVAYLGFPQDPTDVPTR
ncbi:winged helix-turn-helix domain-containing protein [Nocardioides caeni]|uniref:ArsR family transcriptional regulator n=1 Tax=Nocardioides caeni TaxID=574700 RepID=A0A4S8NCN9_9ACTN|nr:helix-turn-helix domain-containing protein [Nocardioides caeni]THV12899.1 ArsR family transcriptional regulator [Nocardioides caeni]